MRAVVTGAEGFAGRWLLAHLQAAGDTVVPAGNAVDVTNAEAVAELVRDSRPDAIYHLAGQASVGASWTEAAQTFTVNATGTLNVLQAALCGEPRPRVLVVSSAEVYGRPAALPLAESAPLLPVTPYAASKAAAEVLARQAHLGRGLHVVIARPFNHTGPGQRPEFVVPALARQVAQAVRGGGEVKALRAGNFSARRDLTDVRDVVRAYRLLLERGAPGEAYNVCSGTAVSVESIATRLLALAGLELPLAGDPAAARPLDVPELRGDPGLVGSATGWRPEIAWDQTLSDVLDEWLDASPGEDGAAG